MNQRISSGWDHDPHHFTARRTMPRDWRLEGVSDAEHYTTWAVFAVSAVMFLSALLLWWFE